MNQAPKTPKNKKTDRIDFKTGVSETLYRKAGGQCSVPRCKNPTMGPYYSQDGAVNMGVACHIYSAAVNGPRGRGGKDEDFISSEKNGIWCCQYHASLIDKSKGCDYSAADLFAWKNLAEARTLKKMNDKPSPLGWVESIELTKFPKTLDKLPKVTLSRRTLLYGKNCSGKTVLLQAAAFISQARYAGRFTSSQKNKDTILCAKIIYSTVDSLNKELTLKIQGMELIRLEGNTQCLLPPSDLEVIYCTQHEITKSPYEDDIDFMMRLLNIDKSVLFSLARIGTNSIIPGEIKFEKAMEEDDETESLKPRYKENGKPYFELLFKMSMRDDFVTYDALSTGEKSKLIIDLLITKARQVSNKRLTLLLLDDLPSIFDRGSFETLLRQLANEEFQVVVTLPYNREKDILQVDNGQSILQTLDYLESWRLAII